MTDGRGYGWQRQCHLLTMADVHTANATDLDAHLGRGGRLLVVYFWGAKCPNCELFASRLPHLLNALEGQPVDLIKVDAYQEPEVATRFGVHGIPAFFLFRDGVRLGRMSEFRGDAFWLSVVRDHLTSGRS